MLVMYHYGHHGNPTHHNFGTKDKADYRHKHTITINGEGSVQTIKDAMTEEEKGYERQPKK